MIEKNDEKHFIDIFTKGYSVRIQETPISGKCVEKIEDFFTNLVWVLNDTKNIILKIKKEILTFNPENR